MVRVTEKRSDGNLFLIIDQIKWAKINVKSFKILETHSEFANIFIRMSNIKK